MRKGRLVLAASAMAALLAISPKLPVVRAADHGDAPGVRTDSRLDINDVYVFQSPNQPGNVVVIVTVSPLVGITGQATFHPTADYDIFVNTDADPDFDFSFNFRFSPPGDGNIQDMHVTAQSRTTRIFDLQESTGRTIDVPGGGFVRANNIDDPFFFDLIAFKQNLSFCPGTARQGINFFRGVNTLAIGLELPRSFFGTNNIGVWARTALNGVQFDRMGRPAINTVLIPSSMKDAFNLASPVNDQTLFRDAFTATARALGNSPDRANFLADFLLPDIMSIDTSKSDGFPNGRRLQDDVIDIELNLLTNGAVTTDCVANDSNFRTTFPYWAGPNP